jgi:hypothetical protein
MKPALLIFLLLAVCSASWCQNKYPLVRLSALEKVSADTVLFNAYVIDVYVCPPCPPGAICKPCNENNLTVVEETPGDITNIPLEKRVRIFSENPNRVKVGNRYLFTATFRNKKVSPKDNLKLVAFK